MALLSKKREFEPIPPLCDERRGELIFIEFLGPPFSSKCWKKNGKARIGNWKFRLCLQIDLRVPGFIQLVERGNNRFWFKNSVS